MDEIYKKQKIELKRNLLSLTEKYPLTDEAKEAFESFPDDVDELRDMLTKEKSISEMRDSLDGNVVQRLEDTLEKLRNCEKSLVEAKGKFESISERIDTLRNDWYPRVTTMIQEISQRFQTLFDGM